MASLIEIFKLNSIDPYVYLGATIEAVANGHPKSLIDHLMPWTFAKTSTR
jgi:transposase